MNFITDQNLGSGLYVDPVTKKLCANSGGSDVKMALLQLNVDGVTGWAQLNTLFNTINTTFQFDDVYDPGHYRLVTDYVVPNRTCNFVICDTMVEITYDSGEVLRATAYMKKTYEGPSGIVFEVFISDTNNRALQTNASINILVFETPVSS